MSRFQVGSTLPGSVGVRIALCTGLALVLAIAGRAGASSRGKVGYSGNPNTQSGATCSNCHAGGQVPTVTLAGPTEVEVSTTNGYTLTITGGQRVAGGLDVSASGGWLDLPTGATDVQLPRHMVTGEGQRRVQQRVRPLGGGERCPEQLAQHRSEVVRQPAVESDRVVPDVGHRLGDEQLPGVALKREVTQAMLQHEFLEDAVRGNAKGRVNK